MLLNQAKWRSMIHVSPSLWRLDLHERRHFNHDVTSITIFLINSSQQN
jgi:predicted alpha/beta superfamily hydrolase